MKGTKRKISLVIFFSKKLHAKLLNSKMKEKKRKNSLTSRKRNKYQTNRNCHKARDKKIHMVEASIISRAWLTSNTRLRDI